MDKRKIKEILDNYSAEAQTIKAIEKLAELQAELSRMLIGHGSQDAMKEKLADVSIMITQLMAIFDIDPAEFDEILEFKLNWQIRRIRGGRYATGSTDRTEGISRGRVMEELIRRSDAIKAFCMDCKGQGEPCEHSDTCKTMKVLRSSKKIPAIEQIPKGIVEQAGNGNVIMSENTYDELIEGSTRRKKGSWIYYGKPIPATSDHYGADCSECGAYSEYLDNFCGNCGADMRGEEQ